MSEINVTPLVDVMLVLLIIFMITTPLLESGIEVDLPKTASGPLNTAEDSQLILAITKDKSIFLNKTKLPIKTLREKLHAIYSNRSNKQLYVRADQAVPYGFVAQVMAEIRLSGIEAVGLVTEPLREI
ncbi:MAG: protein TolR [Deltaproteobacteria bacterium RIFCSPHIGHO2_12_FULL_43_9]|nr:MAG: protein TolR [Deltaproteobacteria bacterium RIFCSPHIGHO2_12_FULL_43_9]